jgi:hypothetical protein
VMRRARVGLPTDAPRRPSDDRRLAVEHAHGLSFP